MPARKPEGRARRPVVPFLLGAIAVFAGAYLLSRATEPKPPVPGVATSEPARPPSLVLRSPDGQLAASAGPAPALKGQEAEAHKREAEERLASYRKFAQYPPGSRPASEHPDQMHPLAPVVRNLPLTARGVASEDIRVQLGQDRRELVGDEAVRLWVRCEDSLGKVLPCRVEQAELLVPPGSEGAPSPAPVTFSDDGRGGDDQSGDGTLTARVVPSQLGFSRHHGTLRVQTTITIEKERGAAFFDFLYTDAAPARFTGAVKESLGGGSLLFSVGLQVMKPGRYFVIARVDDANQKPFAYLEWDGPLSAGEQTVPLTVFGKLLRDGRPAMPLALRDVEGYLFFEDTMPDRAHLPRLAGVVHKTEVYSLAEFSEQEWDSEQKRRYVTEYEKDVAEAGAATKPSRP